MHLTGVPDDLEKALLANPVFRDKIATHDLLTYALKESGKYLAMITAEQLQHGDIMAHTSLMPLAAAESVASAVDFAMKYRVGASMATMASGTIGI